MTTQATEDDLMYALSDLFIDNEVEYAYIAAVAREFPLAEVEIALFRFVAPVCFQNLSTPVPPVWAMFDREELLSDIERLKRRQATAGWWRTTKARWLEAYLRRRFCDEWETLKSVIDADAAFQQ
ncbi:DUF7079 family protein [Enterovibrio norvegicus]|uniref:DUF7079 family protein n=1 Tax=Enterovibrio norvegicus TaxID=188144 RepID=UPI000C83B10C|nr:hypothetical protein [Enterovibrio norvegicus]PML80370.1 hypothetical protein BCT69_11400 [Enterovibrio norvegicus]PMN70377.1 hypothetical protein BCT27_18740 [Enterovibrio norvegicus]